jgi:nucleoside-diphosphate-sugar epimerase
MKKVRLLITGSSGFIGSNLCTLLASHKNYYTIGVDKVFPRTGILPNEFIHKDLTIGIDEDINFDICIHLASEVGGILYNNVVSDNIHKNNSKIDSTLFDILKRNGKKPMIFISSINVFEGQYDFVESAMPINIRELTSYSKSKLLSEHFFCSNLKDIAVIRPTNIFGKSQIKTHSKTGESHVIPDLLSKIESSTDEILVFGDGTQKRNFLHVIDLCEFIKGLVDNFSSGFYNIRSDNTISISKLVEELIIFKKKMNLKIRFQSEYMVYEKIKIYEFEINNAHSRGWRPTINSICKGLLI